MEGTLQDDVAIGKDGIRVAVLVCGGGDQVALVVRTQLAQGVPVVLRMHEDGIVLGGAEVQDWLEHLVAHLDAGERLVGGRLVFCGDDGDHVAHIAHMTVDDQAVVGAGLRIGLTGVGEAVLRDVFPGVDSHDAIELERLGGVDGLDYRVGMRAAQELDHKRVRHDVLCVDGLAEQELHGVLLADGLAHGLVIGPIHG